MSNLLGLIDSYVECREIITVYDARSRYIPRKYEKEAAAAYKKISDALTDLKLLLERASMAYPHFESGEGAEVLAKAKEWLDE